MVNEQEYDWADNARQGYEVGIKALREELQAVPCVTVGRVRLYNADIRDICHLLPKAQCVVTDPPYMLTSGGVPKEDGVHRVMRGGWMREYNNNGKLMPCDLPWSEVMRIIHGLCASDADAYVMSNDKNLLPCLKASEEAGFNIHNILVWDKVNVTANRWYMKQCEFIAYLWKGKARKINDCGSKQLFRMRQKDVTDHPTEKPVDLMEDFIANSTKQHDLVIDPFMGSGTTGCAAIRCNRNFIGVEKDKTFFEMAVKRLNNEMQIHLEEEEEWKGCLEVD